MRISTYQKPRPASNRKQELRLKSGIEARIPRYVISEPKKIKLNDGIGSQRYQLIIVEKIRFLDEKFDLLHPYGKLKHGPYMLDRTIIYLTRAATEENIKISQRVIQMFSKTRFFHSLRMMQKDINSMNKKSVREYKQIGQHST